MPLTRYLDGGAHILPADETLIRFAMTNGEPHQTLERFFYVRSPTSVLGLTNWTDLEKEVMRQHRWWQVGDLIAATDAIFPPRFGLLVERFLLEGSAGPEEIPL